MTLSNLITRLEGMTGPDREVDALIFKAIGAPLPQKFLNRGISLEWKEDERCFVMPIDGMRIRYEQPAFTSSLDAAMSLVPKPWRVIDIHQCDDDSWHAAVRIPGFEVGTEESCQNPAIALCIASLRAIQEPAQ